ncbi:hypothetical protein [Streptomyces hokutonensis]|uniref:hypothetical protein n=1 Tax=Streptomyces hokutonensis TaxID=1306990 RepID=UPI0003AA893C|nr:hypothetical protein [Streptomyces hokutonensis]
MARRFPRGADAGCAAAHGTRAAPARGGQRLLLRAHGYGSVGRGGTPWAPVAAVRERELRHCAGASGSGTSRGDGTTASSPGPTPNRRTPRGHA